MLDDSLLLNLMPHPPAPGKYTDMFYFALWTQTHYRKCMLAFVVTFYVTRCSFSVYTMSFVLQLLQLGLLEIFNPWRLKSFWCRWKYIYFCYHFSTVMVHWYEIFTWKTKIRLKTCGPFYLHGLTLIPAWISNHIHYKVWDEITYPFLNFNGCTVEV